MRRRIYNKKNSSVLFGQVTEAEPGSKGNTAGGRVERPVIVETGASVNVPMFVNEGDEIRVDVETGKYLGRAGD